MKFAGDRQALTPASHEPPENPSQQGSGVAGAESLGLPDPRDRSSADVVIIDGQCGFCRQQAGRLARLDRSGRLAFLSLHDPRVAERYPELSHDQLMEQMYVVERDGRSHGGAAALRYLSRRLPSLWWLAPVLHIPGTLSFWQWAYRQVARRRYAISRRKGYTADCENGSCEVHFGGKP